VIVQVDEDEAAPTANKQASKQATTGALPAWQQQDSDR
jgi:hypothetical protein